MFSEKCQKDYSLDDEFLHGKISLSLFPVNVRCQSGFWRAVGKVFILLGLELFPGEKENSYNQEDTGDHRSQDDGESNRIGHLYHVRQ